ATRPPASRHLRASADPPLCESSVETQLQLRTHRRRIPRCSDKFPRCDVYPSTPPAAQQNKLPELFGPTSGLATRTDSLRSVALRCWRRVVSCYFRHGRLHAGWLPSRNHGGAKSSDLPTRSPQMLLASQCGLNRPICIVKSAFARFSTSRSGARSSTPKPAAPENVIILLLRPTR